VELNREQFEDWARRGGMEVHRNGTPDYIRTNTQTAWESWQAAAALSPAKVEGVEPVAWLNKKHSFVRDAFIWNRDERNHPDYNEAVYTAAQLEQAVRAEREKCARVAEVRGLIYHEKSGMRDLHNGITEAIRSRSKEST